MRFLQVLLLGAVAAGANAGTLYRIDFEGTVTRGSLRGTTNVQGSYNLGFEVGGPVRGHVLLDLGLAPAQSDTTNGGLFRTEFSDTLGAAWLAAWVDLVLPELPADALPVPSSFVVAPGGLPGATYSAPVEASRSAAFTQRGGLLQHGVDGARFRGNRDGGNTALSARGATWAADHVGRPVLRARRGATRALHGKQPGRRFALPVPAV